MQCDSWKSGTRAIYKWLVLEYYINIENKSTIMTTQNIIKFTAERLAPGFLEENDIVGFMNATLEAIGDLGLQEVEVFGTTDYNTACDKLYVMAEEVRALYLA